MKPIKDIIASIEYRFSVDRVYLYIALAALSALILSLILFFIFRPKPSQIPPLPAGSLNSGLVAYWGFEENEGQKILNAANQTILSGRFGSSGAPDGSDPQRIKKGKLGRALKFDGADDYVIVPFDGSLNFENSLTLEGWFKVEGAAAASPPPIWLENFQYRRAIILDNTRSSQSFENFQILINFNTKILIEEGKLLPDCRDLRAADEDETSQLTYWLESGCGQEARLWVRVPAISARAQKTIYIYYGNSQAQDQSSYNNTMKVPPVTWWDYEHDYEHDREPGIWGFSVNKMALHPNGNLWLAGSATESRDGNLGWAREVLSLSGTAVDGSFDNISTKTDVIQDIAIDRQGRAVLGGFDELPGDAQWTARGGWSFSKNYSSGSDEIRAVAIDSEGNTVLAGYDSVPGDAQWRMVKLNQAGQELWEKTINPSSGADIIVDAAIDSRNNIVVAGFEKVLGNDRWRIEKFDPNGKFLSSYRLDVSDGADVLNAIAIDSKDNVIAVGYDFFHGDAQWRIVKVDPEVKSRVWQWTFNPSSDFDELASVAVDSLDNIIAAGYDMAEGNAGWTIIKFSPQGEKIWEWKFNPSSQNDIPKDIIVNQEDDIIIAGSNFSRGKNPEWFAVKISEKTPIFPKPEITVGFEERPKALGENIILIKPGSWQVSAVAGKFLGIVNRNPITAANLLPGSWNHFAMTYDGSRQILYINGRLVNSFALSGKMEANSSNLFIGYNFNGLVDELKIYDRALSAEEIKQLYLKER